MLVGFFFFFNEIISHPTELSNAGVSGLSKPLGLNCRLTEEEKYLVIIRVFTLRDPKGTNKLWFWNIQEYIVKPVFSQK